MRPGDVAQGEDSSRAEQIEFGFEKWKAVVDFGWRRFIRWRGATRDCADVGVVEIETIGARDGCGLAGESGAMELFVQEVAAAVSSEHASSAIRAVGRGGQANDQELSVRIAEAGDGAAPVRFVPVGTALDARDFLAVANQARAFAALDDLSVEYD